VFCLTVGCDVDEYAAFKVSWQAMFAERLSGRSGRRAASQPLLAHERHAVAERMFMRAHALTEVQAMKDYPRSTAFSGMRSAPAVPPVLSNETYVP